MNLANILFDHGAARAEQTALIAPRTSRTYGALRERTARLAGGLAALGISPGDRVAVLLPSGPDFVETYLAVATLGALVVPLNSRLTPREHITLMRQAAPRGLVASVDHAETVALARVEVTGLGAVIASGGDLPEAIGYEGLIAGATPITTPVDAAHGDPAVLLYTSGTTSGAKGAVLTHGNLLSNMQQYQAAVGIPEGSVNLQLSPLYHAANIFTFIHLLVGGTTVFLDKPTPPAILEAIATRHVTFMFTVPTVLYALLDSPERDAFDLSSLQTIQYGAAAITGARLDAALQVFGPRLLHSYGMTETTSHVSILGKAEHCVAQGSVGRPLPGVEVRIADDGGAALPARVVGEILVRGANVTPGYWQRPEETAEALRDGWFHTGDLGRFDDAGFLYIAGRKKDLIISGGVNIYPGDIEEVLALHPSVAEAAAFAFADPLWGEAVAVAIVPRAGGAAADPEALKAFLRGHLGGFKVPKAMFILDAMPRNAAGKVLKRELRAIAETELACGTAEGAGDPIADPDNNVDPGGAEEGSRG